MVSPPSVQNLTVKKTFESDKNNSTSKVSVGFYSFYFSFLSYDFKQALASNEKKSLSSSCDVSPSNYCHLLHVGTRFLDQLFFILLERCCSFLSCCSSSHRFLKYKLDE